MGWEFPSNTNIASDKPVRASDILRIRDLVPALAAGDVGAPRIAPDALEVPPVGSNDTYQSPSRAIDVVHQNTTGQTILVDVHVNDPQTVGVGGGAIKFQVSTDNSNWLDLRSSSNVIEVIAIIAPNEYYGVFLTGNIQSASIRRWLERRP